MGNLAQARPSVEDLAPPRRGLKIARPFAAVPLEALGELRHWPKRRIVVYLALIARARGTTWTVTAAQLAGDTGIRASHVRDEIAELLASDVLRRGEGSSHGRDGTSWRFAWLDYEPKRGELLEEPTTEDAGEDLAEPVDVTEDAELLEDLEDLEDAPSCPVEAPSPSDVRELGPRAEDAPRSDVAPRLAKCEPTAEPSSAPSAPATVAPVSACPTGGATGCPAGGATIITRSFSLETSCPSFHPETSSTRVRARDGGKDLRIWIQTRAARGGLGTSSPAAIGRLLERGAASCSAEGLARPSAREWAGFCRATFEDRTILIGARNPLAVAFCAARVVAFFRARVRSAEQLEAERKAEQLEREQLERDRPTAEQLAARARDLELLGIFTAADRERLEAERAAERAAWARRC